MICQKLAKLPAQLLFIFLYRCVLHFSDVIIVHGNSSQITLSREYRAKSSKIFSIPYGIPFQKGHEYTERLSNDKIQKNEIILAFGVISPRKGLDVLIKAFEKVSIDHPSWKLVIAGRVQPYYSYYYKNLKELAAKMIENKRVIFLGKFEQTDLNELLESSKLVVFPYLYNFGASSTLTFALQHRKVVVISALNFSKDLLTDNKNAILVPPNDSTLLSKAIERGMSDDYLRYSIKKNVDLLLEINSWDFVARKTMQVYNKVLSTKINHKGNIEN